MTPPHDTARTASDQEELILMGVTGRAHGIHGEVKVRPETDAPERFELVETLYLGLDAAATRPYTVEGVRYQTTKLGLTVVLALAGVDARVAAEGLRGLQVFARRSDLPPLDEDEFFIADLIGLQVVAEDGTSVGTIRDVLETAAHELLVVGRSGQPDAMVPFVDAFIAEIDFDAGQVMIRPIEGLIE